MKKGLLGSTALVSATVSAVSLVGVTEALAQKLTGNVNIPFDSVDQGSTGTWLSATGSLWSGLRPVPWATTAATFSGGDIRDRRWYFGVDEAELQLDVSGTADNGLHYGFKIELNGNTFDLSATDEARLQLSDAWGTLQLGDEDGAEDIMNYGGENLMGAAGGFDGEQGDALTRMRATVDGFEFLAAPSFPTIAGDTSDATKASYYTPRFAGFQVGGSVTPTPNNGDGFKADGTWENHYGVGANYDSSFGGVRIRASAVYSGATVNAVGKEDISAWSVGGIVGFGPVSLGANYTDNGDSGSPTPAVGNSEFESSYWDVALAFESGPLYLSAGYFSSVMEYGGAVPLFLDDSTFQNISLTADYSVAAGLGLYAEVNLIEDDVGGSDCIIGCGDSNATVIIAGANVSF